MSNPPNDRLRALLEPLAVKAGFDLEEVKVTQAGKRRRLEIAVDGDEGVSLDEVAELSRVFGEALDESDVMGGAPYVLEVGSPGVDRPLTHPRHWRRAVGRLVKAQLAEGGEVTGRVLEAGEDGVLLLVPPVKGRGKAAERRVEYAEIARARVEIEFNRKDGSGDVEDVAEEDDASVEGE